MDESKLKNRRYADVIVEISHEKVDRAFQYLIPEALLGRIVPGIRVHVPFGQGNKDMTGYVVELSEKADYPVEKMKEIRSIDEKGTTLESDLIQTAYWMKSHYGSTMITALKTVLPVKQKLKQPERKKIIRRCGREEIKKALETGLLPKVDFAMIAEPTDMKLVAVHKGEAWADVEFFGKSAHSSIPWEGRNAICMAARFIEKLQFRIHELEAQATEDGVPTMNVGVISGGSSPNVVPPYAKVKVDIRYLPGQGYEQYAAVLEEVLDACKSEWPEFSGKVTVTGNWNSLLTRRDEPVLKRVEQLITESTGEPVAYTTLKGWGEGGYINMFGIPTVYYGPGDGTYSHKPDEKIEIRRIPIVAKVYYNILKGLCF